MHSKVKIVMNMIHRFNYTVLEHYVMPLVIELRLIYGWGGKQPRLIHDGASSQCYKGYV